VRTGDAICRPPRSRPGREPVPATFGCGEWRTIDGDGDHGHATFERASQFESDQIVWCVDPPSPRRVLREEPVADDGDHDSTLLKVRLDYSAVVPSDLIGVDVDYDRVGSQVALEVVGETTSSILCVLSSIADEDDAHVATSPFLAATSCIAYFRSVGRSIGYGPVALRSDRLRHVALFDAAPYRRLDVKKHTAQRPGGSAEGFAAQGPAAAPGEMC
jgi:hypothetical protein